MLKVFGAPARYTQGPHATEQLGAEIRALGLKGPAFLIAGSSAIRLLSETWSKTFAASEMSHAILPLGGECTAAEIRRGCQATREANARVVIGAGGGKVLDTARALASDLSLPVVNCPTLASSDAPCSALSVIYTEVGAWEEYRIFRRNPDVVLDTLANSGSGNLSLPKLESRLSRANPRIGGGRRLLQFFYAVWLWRG